jgi:hypothetical protein
VSEEEGYRARGYVKFEGDWITPAEHEAILRERVSSAQQESALRQAEVAEREAEARAREAEARAREAEAQAAEAQETSEGLPLWYGWGVGPISWRTTPAVTHPIGPRPPAGVPR